MKAELRVTSGTGPAEAGWFADALADRLAADLASVLAWRAGRSLGLEVAPSALGDHIGTHALVWKTGRGRKRWFVGVEGFAPPVEVPALDPRDVVLTAMRAGGPGGQCVNTTSSAVLARHLPTGLVVRVQDERSQHANRRVAMVRLAEALAAVGREQAAARDRSQWLVHHQLVRGAPVAEWRRDARGGLVRVD